ncbi:MAG: hypothetical protein V1754_08720 [Pseudomonadota bacterium]
MRNLFGIGVLVSIALAMAFCTGSMVMSKHDGGDGPVPCYGGQDSDGDTIFDEHEGCEQDADGDGIPNHQDLDSDGDGIPDQTEAGDSDPSTLPIDTDQDGVPNFLDTDSDNDGVLDKNEDRDGDGRVGCCRKTCGEVVPGCKDVEPGKCAGGQECNGGICQPALHFLCSDGESDPLQSASFDGIPDANQDFGICNAKDEHNEKGYKIMSFRKNTNGNWHVALEETALFAELQINNAKGQETAASFDLIGANEAVAGFLVSYPCSVVSATDEASTVTSRVLGISGSGASPASGTPKQTHDGYPTVVNTVVQVQTSSMTVGALRNKLYPALLNRDVSDFPSLPNDNFGQAATDYTVRFQTLLREKDSECLVMGAVSETATYNNPAMTTGFHVDDLSNGTGLANSGNGPTVECDPFILESLPVADIIWVVDESGSTNDDRQNIVDNATNFFDRAVSSGLDFRMGVTSMDKAALGKFCSVANNTDINHDGGADRFLTSAEKTIFSACIKNPPMYDGSEEFGLMNAFEAVKRHLPRAANAPTKIRTDAKLVIIWVGDERPQSMEDYGISPRDCPIDPSDKSQVQNFVQNYIDYYQGKSDPEATAIAHAIHVICPQSCSQPEYGYGYIEVLQALGGQIGDICQTDLGPTLQIIIDSIAGAASNAILEYAPISASLAVSLGGQVLIRSRSLGFDYAPYSNSLVFYGVKLNKGDQVVASYQRWIEQVSVQ